MRTIFMYFFNHIQDDLFSFSSNKAIKKFYIRSLEVKSNSFSLLNNK